MLQLRQYQKDLSQKACDTLKGRKIVYLSMEVRTGKTATSLNTAYLFRAKNVLFLTKKKAMKSIEDDYVNFGFNRKFNLTIINDESLHMIDGKFDLIIHDEHHRFGAFPKPNIVAKLFKERYSSLPMIFLSGTPHPESYSQIYHQFWVSDYSPFRNYRNFYKWAKDYVEVKQRYLGYATVNDYSHGIEKKIKGMIRHFMIPFTQKEAGFTTHVNEMVLECEMLPITYKIIDKLKKDLVVKNSKGQLILADTGAKLMQKVHQLSSGTCKFECGGSKVIDNSKALFIADKFKDVKIGIFYKYKEEYNALKSVLKDKLTDNLAEFNNDSNKWIALQIVSGREGISLKESKYLVYYNIDYSAVSYWQSRDRLTTMERKENEIFYIFAKNGIEHNIYKSVLKKKNYTLSNFTKDYGIKDTIKDQKEVRAARMASR